MINYERCDDYTVNNFYMVEEIEFPPLGRSAPDRLFFALGIRNYDEIAICCSPYEIRGDKSHFVGSEFV